MPHMDETEGPGPDNRPQPDFNRGGGDCHFHGDNHNFYGGFPPVNPWNFLAPAIGGFIGGQIQQQQQAALTAQRLVVNPATGVQEMRSPGYWSIVNGAPAFLPLACWMN